MTVKVLDRLVAKVGLNRAVETAIAIGSLGKFARGGDPKRKERMLLEWLTDQQAAEIEALFPNGVHEKAISI
jgi:hypothetical protein